MAHYGRNTYITWNGDAILDVLQFSGVNATTDAIENTPYGKDVREYYPGYKDYGSVSITVSTVETMDVYRIRKSYIDHTISTLTIVTPAGMQYDFRGFVTSLVHTMDKAGLYTITITIKISGKPLTKLYTSYKILPRANATLYRGCAYGLFLTPTTDNTVPVGGEGVKWVVTGAQSAETGITDNTLMIASGETAGSLQVVAYIQSSDDPSTTTTSGPVTYTISPPPITAIAITELDGSSHSVSAATLAAGDVAWDGYDATVYPNGARKEAVTWTLTAKNNTQVALQDATINLGTITFHARFATTYPAGASYQFWVTAQSNTGGYDRKLLTVTVTV